MNGLQLKNWRMNQKPKVSRLKMAELLSESAGVTITTTVIRDIEEERSSKWVREYEEWAKSNWSESTRPLSFNALDPSELDIPRSRFLPPLLLNILDTTSGRDKNWRVVKSDEIWVCPLILPDFYSRYIFVQINGSGLDPVFPHSSILVFLAMTIPPIGSIALRQIEDEYEIGFLTTTQIGVQMITFPTQQHGYEGVVFGALVGVFKQWEFSNGESHNNIEWNNGRPIQLPSDCRGLIQIEPS